MGAAGVTKFLMGLATALAVVFLYGYYVVHSAHVNSPGMLQCVEGGEPQYIAISSDMTYIGNGEWRMVLSDGRYQVFVKSVTESCMIVPIPGQDDGVSSPSVPARPIVGDKGELNVQSESKNLNGIAQQGQIR